MANARGGLEAVHERHLDVKDNGGKPVSSNEVDCLLSRLRLDQLGTNRVQNRLERHQVSWRVIDEQDPRLGRLDVSHLVYPLTRKSARGDLRGRPPNGLVQLVAAEVLHLGPDKGLAELGHDLR